MNNLGGMVFIAAGIFGLYLVFTGRATSFVQALSKQNAGSSAGGAGGGSIVLPPVSAPVHTAPPNLPAPSPAPTP